MTLPIKRISLQQLGELLVERSVITQAQLARALEVQKDKGGLIGEVLIELKMVKEEAIAQALTAQYGFPYLPLINYEVDPEIVNIVPYNVANQYCLICIDKIGNNLTIAMANPLNLPAIEDVELISSCSVQIFVSTTSDVRTAIARHYRK